MSTGYHNADGLWIAAYEHHQEEIKLERLIFEAKHGTLLINQNDREYLLEHGYNTKGEYIND